ncbi:hypothetical protein VSDG_04341 [Cytospora chrysosperma]|uniref:FAD-binding domain-containing protein n=1 Tax=Cytospora chrysosperma TaxID=252740 RepID=A0A423W5T2_CYTCH|nr:hypothetical protein VSDG_04341 [Valsa sordida]
MADKTSKGPFKVIIVGGSIAGLTLANALEKAGIDYVLLEKRDVAPNVGQTIFVLPCTSLVLEQLGISKTLESIAIPLKTREHWAGSGKNGEAKLFCSSDELWRLYEKSQRPVRFVDRYRFLSGLYEGIKDKSRIHTREGIVSFIETENGVTVRTDQGNTFEGSILVGADGVHSETRRQLSLASQEQDPKRSKILGNGFITRYVCLTALSHNHFADEPNRPFLADGVVNNAYHEEEGLGTISCAGTANQLIWSIYIPVDQTEYPSPKYGQEDIDAFVKKYGHVKFCADYSISDVYKTKIGANMIAMEENVLPTKWHSGKRVVLVGDAVHKATANLGMGGNLCIDDVCRLVNGLVPLLKTNDAPSTQELVKVFMEYERAAKPRALFVNRASAFFCGFETMTAWYARVTKLIFPWIPSSLKMMVFSIFDGAAPNLSYLPVPPAKFVA